MPNQSLNDLIKIADALDEKGLNKEADFVDSVVKSAVERSRAVQDFIDQLKKAFSGISESSKAFPNIRKALPEILRLIDITANYKEFLQPSVSVKTYEALQDITKGLAENISSLQDNIDDIKKEMATEKDAEKLHRLQLEMQHYDKELTKNWASVKQLQEKDAEKFRKFVQMYDEKRKQKIIRDYKGK